MTFWQSTCSPNIRLRDVFKKLLLMRLLSRDNKSNIDEGCELSSRFNKEEDRGSVNYYTTGNKDR